MIWLGVIAAVFLLDHRIKKWAEQHLAGKGKKKIGNTGFSFQLLHNSGFAGSKMKQHPVFVKFVHGTVLLFCSIGCVLLGCFKKERWATALGASLMIGGGISNFYDRIKKGYVVDYLGLPVARRLVFNLSDLCIFAGMILVLIGDFLNTVRAILTSNV